MSHSALSAQREHTHLPPMVKIALAQKWAGERDKGEEEV
jgi:hypothetical protein